jgi:hypothetical protein
LSCSYLCGTIQWPFFCLNSTIFSYCWCQILSSWCLKGWDVLE